MQFLYKVEKREKLDPGVKLNYSILTPVLKWIINKLIRAVVLFIKKKLF